MAIFQFATDSADADLWAKLNAICRPIDTWRWTQLVVWATDWLSEKRISDVIYLSPNSENLSAAMARFPPFAFKFKNFNLIRFSRLDS
jgi:hypothetical protein